MTQAVERVGGDGRQSTPLPWQASQRRGILGAALEKSDENVPGDHILPSGL